ncbi:MAG: hypothetical protein KME47_09560 [Nodosilinea sp. WJT8-NPBG4]|jgi:hypothetical protein|nr:hypothetical protein [Nodosilinea sp. WJT8-NPBG4]
METNYQNELEEVLNYCLKHKYSFNYSYTPHSSRHYFYITSDDFDVMEQGIAHTKEKAFADFMLDFKARRIKYKD